MVIDCKFGYCGLKMEDSVPSGSVCCFCLTTYEDEVLYGKFYKIEEITTHYFCLLLSSKIQQRGSDAQGILGFLPKDIRNEVRRGKNVSCTYCGKRGATLSCHYSKCKIHFHLPCGRTRDTFHEFFGEFKSFCCKHRKSQRIKQEVLKAMSGKRSTCSICLESVPATPSPNTLWAPCCSKDAWFHRICIQRLALSAGYFFKCPLCNNTAEFLESMRTYGIWIPEQDAAWERDPERYEGLLQRHNSCDAKSCRCRSGRTHHVADTKWEIKLCADCGSQGMHVQCGNLRQSEDWICSVCSNVSTPPDIHHQKSRKISHSREALMARNRERRSLPVRPTQRVTRQRRPPEDEDGEEGEEEGSRPLHSVHSKSEIPALKTDKGASSTPQKDVSCLPLLVQESTAQSRETRPESQPSLPQDENSDVEILENSDDEIQILPTPNIRFIKTNLGVSVPVVKVHATQPSGEEVVAAGEPCQPTSRSDQSAPMDNDSENFDLSVCEPSTFQLPNQSLPVENEIVLDDEPLQSSQQDDDIVIVEFKQPNQIPLVNQALDLPSPSTSSVEFHISPEEASKNATKTKMPSKDASHSKSSGIEVEFAEHESISSAQPEASSDHNGPTTESADSEMEAGVMSVSPATREQSSQINLSKNVQKFATATGLLKMFHDMQAVHRASVATMEAQQQRTGVSSVQPEMFMPTANVFQSKSPLTPNMTTSTSASPEICISVQAGTESDMSAWRSKVLNLVRGFPNDTQFTISPVSVSSGNVTADIEPAQVPLISEGVPLQLPGTPRSTLPSSLASYYAKTHSSDPSRLHSHPVSVVKEYTSQLQMPKDQTNSSGMISRHVLISHPSQAQREDWSVEFVPGSHVDTGCVNTQQSVAEEHPNVVFERHTGSVPKGQIPWEEHETSSPDTDEIIVVDDVDDDDSKSAANKRERKQKFVERCDFSQSFSASHSHSMGESQRMSHFSAIANGVTSPGTYTTQAEPTSAVTAVTGPSNIYILVNPLLPPPLRTHKTSSQDFYQP